MSFDRNDAVLFVASRCREAGKAAVDLKRNTRSTGTEVPIDPTRVGLRRLE